MEMQNVNGDGDCHISFDVVARKCPVTAKRLPAVAAAFHIEKPSIPRASVAVSAEVPYNHGDYAREHSEETVLQQHVLFWDRDNDGQIYPWDTYVGFRDLGFNRLFSLFAMLIINFNFSYPTRLLYSYIPDPLFRIYVGGIYKAKDPILKEVAAQHGSDTGVYDTEGRFIPQKFEDLFSKWSVRDDDSLTLTELFNMMHGNRVVADPFGWLAAFFEFGTTWLLVQRNGKVYKEDLRRVYDGSLFWAIREMRRSGKGWHQGFGIGGDGFIGGLSVDSY